MYWKYGKESHILLYFDRIIFIKIYIHVQIASVLYHSPILQSIVAWLGRVQLCVHLYFDLHSCGSVPWCVYAYVRQWVCAFWVVGTL